MDKKLKRSLSIVLGGYLSSVGFYLIWYFTKWRFSFYAMHSRDADLLENVVVVFTITVLYFFSLLLIWSVRPLQNVWKSFSLVFIITLLTIFLIPSTYYSIYYKSYGNRLNQKQDKTIKPIDENERERKNLPVNIKENRKQHEDPKEKIPAEQNHKKETEAKLNNVIAANEAADKSIAELQTKLKIEREENDKLRKQLNETIEKSKLKENIILELRSKLEEKQKNEEYRLVQKLVNTDFSKEKINSEANNTDSKTKNQEIIFRVQIISSGSRLGTNSHRFKGLKNVWEYEDNGLFKYTVGNKKDLKSASLLQSEIRRKGFAGAFVVAFINGKRIPVKKAIELYKMQGNS